MWVCTKARRRTVRGLRARGSISWRAYELWPRVNNVQRHDCGRMRACACHMHRLHPVRGHTVRGCRRIGANRTVQRPRACGYVSWRAYKLLLCVNTVHLSDCRRMRACQCKAADMRHCHIA